MLVIMDNTRSHTLSYEEYITQTTPWREAYDIVHNPDVRVDNDTIRKFMNYLNQDEIRREHFYKIHEIYIKQKEEKFQIQKRVALKALEKKQRTFNVKSFILNAVDELLLGYLSERRQIKYENTFI
jgi:hypothetical protein